MVVATGLSQFAIRFSNVAGEWQPSWDSSLLEDSSALPVAAEIELSFALDDAASATRGRIDDFAFADGDSLPGESFARRVTLPMRAVDLAAMLEEAAGKANAGQEEEEEEEEDEGDAEEDGDATDLSTEAAGAAGLPVTPSAERQLAGHTREPTRA
jgi:hypothetical protein